MLSAPPHRTRLYLCQLFLVSLATILWNHVFEGVTGWSELRGSPMGNDWLQVVNGAALGALGLALGLLAYRNSPRVRATGRWVWMLPLSILLIAVLWDLYAVRHPYIFSTYFYWSHPGRTEGPLLRDLLTYPAWASICYSIGIVSGARRNPQRTQTDREEEMTHGTSRSH
jgi:hypothetical protein